MAAQSVLPALWVVVDDGSTDETPAILEEYARRLPYLQVVRRTDRGGRAVGPGVIETFYAGLETVRLENFDYLCKLDMDLDLPPGYFELLMQRMESNPRLGTTSGKPWFVHPHNGALVPEICGDEMSVGMTKFYRVDCFKEIGGFVRQVKQLTQVAALFHFAEFLKPPPAKRPGARRVRECPSGCGATR